MFIPSVSSITFSAKNKGSGGKSGNHNWRILLHGTDHAYTAPRQQPSRRQPRPVSNRPQQSAHNQGHQTTRHISVDVTKTNCAIPALVKILSEDPQIRPLLGREARTPIRIKLSSKAGFPNMVTIQVARGKSAEMKEELLAYPSMEDVTRDPHGTLKFAFDWKDKTDASIRPRILVFEDEV